MTVQIGHKQNSHVAITANKYSEPKHSYVWVRINVEATRPNFGRYGYGRKNG